MLPTCKCIFLQWKCSGSAASGSAAQSDFGPDSAFYPVVFRISKGKFTWGNAEFEACRRGMSGRIGYI